jgi:hypothetical protein
MPYKNYDDAMANYRKTKKAIPAQVASPTPVPRHSVDSGRTTTPLGVVPNSSARSAVAVGDGWPAEAITLQWPKVAMRQMRARAWNKKIR